MSIDKLPTGCVPKTIRCAVTSKGEPVEEMLNALVEDVKCLKDEKCDPCNRCADSEIVETTNQQTTEVGNITTAGSTRNAAVNTPGTITIENGTISYNFADAIASQSCFNSVTSVKIRNSSRILHSGRSSIGSAQIAASDYPVTVSIDVSCYSDSGQKTLSLEKSITGLTKSSEEYLISSESGSPVNTQFEANEHFDSCISELKSKVRSLEVQNSPSEIQSILNDISEIKTEVDQIIVDLQTESTNRMSDISEIRAENKLLSEEIIRLSQQYQQLYSLLIGNNNI